MRNISYNCDRCGKELSYQRDGTTYQMVTQVTDEITSSKYATEHLCISCYKSFCDWLNELNITPRTSDNERLD